MLRNVLGIVFFLILIAPQAKAQSGEITIQDIQDYYEAYANLFTNTSIDIEKLDRFLVTRYRPEAIISSSYTDNITNQRRNYSQTPEESKQSILITAAKMKNMKSKIDFKFLEIADDKKTATIRYHMHYYGTIQTENSTGRTIDVLYKSIAGCAEWLDITNNSIQVKLSSCNVTTNFSNVLKK